VARWAELRREHFVVGKSTVGGLPHRTGARDAPTGLSQSSLGPMGNRLRPSGRPLVAQHQLLQLTPSQFAALQYSGVPPLFWTSERLRPQAAKGCL
jgi:hypothetical protein